MATGPIIGYLAQYRLIRINKQIGSFSIDLCGILLFSNILRLNFYLFQKFQTALVIQSILMITMQIVLLFECTKYIQIQLNQNSNNNPPSSTTTTFWRWPNFDKYCITIFIFTFCTFSLSATILRTPISKTYGQFIGLIALISQSIIVLPQIIKNTQKQSTKGLSYILVSLNIIGDIQKLAYFLIKKQPFQFILCAIIQVFQDTFIIIQIFYYKRLENRDINQQKQQQKKYKIQEIEEPQTKSSEKLGKQDILINQENIGNKFDKICGSKENQKQINRKLNQQQKDNNQQILTKSNKISRYSKLDQQNFIQQENRDKSNEHPREDLNQLSQQPTPSFQLLHQQQLQTPRTLIGNEQQPSISHSHPDHPHNPQENHQNQYCNTIEKI